MANYNINKFNFKGTKKTNKGRCLIIMNKKDESNNEYFTDEDYLDMAGTASASDCTGLISQGSNETDSADEYNDLYQFGIPHVAAKATGESLGKTSTNASEKLSSRTSTSSSAKSSNKTSASASDKSSNKSSASASIHSSNTHKEK